MTEEGCRFLHAGNRFGMIRCCLQIQISVVFKKQKTLGLREINQLYTRNQPYRQEGLGLKRAARLRQNQENEAVCFRSDLVPFLTKHCQSKRCIFFETSLHDVLPPSIATFVAYLADSARKGQKPYQKQGTVRFFSFRNLVNRSFSDTWL